MSINVGVSAKKVAKVAKGEVGYHEGPGNQNKYGPDVAWCVIFLHWVFKHAGGRDPLGNSNVVSGAVAPLPKVSGRKIGDVVTKPSGGAKRGHIGICVGNGQYVAGNSGDAVRYEGGWAEAFRPKYSPDILPVKYNGKTYYYNPETKKLCTDKQGKKPIKGNVGAGGRSSGGRGGSGSGGSGSGGSGSVNVPYLEYYNIKPKNFEDAKDEVYTGKEIDQEPGIRVLMVQLDYQLVQELYPDLVIPSNLESMADLSLSSLISYYNKMIAKMTSNLQQITPIEEESCMYIMGVKNDRYGRCQFIEKYNSNLDIGENYYSPMIDDWIELYNDLVMKRDALLIYQEAGKTYNSYFSTSIYTEVIFQEYSKYYNKAMAYYYNSMQDYIKENSNNLDYAEQIIDLNKEIYSITTDINELRQRLSITFNALPNLLKKKTQKENNIINLKSILDSFKDNYFSNIYTYWNSDIIRSPKSLNFWIDFLSNNSEINKYSIKTLGPQQCVVNNEGISSLYTMKIPQIIYYTDRKYINQLKSGYTHLYYDKDLFNSLFVNSAQGISAKDYSDELIYLHTYFNEQVTLSVIPIYYLEPNTRILLYNKDTHINNEYILNKITIQLAQGTTMNLNASIVPKRLY